MGNGEWGMGDGESERGPLFVEAGCGYTLHAEGITLHDAEHEFRHPVIVFRRVTGNRTDGRLVVVFDAPSECISHQVLREVAYQRNRPPEQGLLQLGG